jgi:hypothetical protein
MRTMTARIGVLVPIAISAVLIAPGSAFACKPTDPQGPAPSGDVCSQSFSTPLPTAAGQTVTDYAIEYIPSDVINVRYSLSFTPQPSNATITQNFDQNATGANPDMTLPKPGPGEQAARVVWTWTATGSGSSASATATFKVTFEEPAKALQVEFLAKKGRRELTRVYVREEFDYVVRVHNPNDDSVTGNLLFDPWPLLFERGGIEYGSHFGTCKFHSDGYRCPFMLPAGGTGTITAFGKYRDRAAQIHPRPKVQAFGQQDPDLQSVTSAVVELMLRVVQ